MLVGFIEGLSSRQKQTLAVALDCVMLPGALWCTLVLRHGHWELDWLQFWPAFAVTLGCVPLFAHLGLYRHIIRYMGPVAILAIVQGVLVTSVVLAAVAYMTRIEDFPRSAPVIFGILSFCYVAGTRFLVHLYAMAVVRSNAARKTVAIYGAGEAGAHLAYRLGREGDYRPVAFIDEDRRTHGRVIHGLPVHPVEALSQLADRHVLSQVLVTAPTSSNDRRRIIERLEPYPVQVRLVPDFHAMVSRDGPLVPIRDLDIGDLLGRDEVAPLPHLLRGSVTNRAVLVTGRRRLHRLGAVPPHPALGAASARHPGT